jgi:hypothetical protein
MKMKRVLIFMVICGILVLNSCTTTNTAGLSTIDKPIRLGQFYIDSRSVSRMGLNSFDDKTVYEFLVRTFFRDLEMISDKVKEQTGFPLDIDRFFAEVKQGGTSVDNTGITWNADSPMRLILSYEPFAQVNVGTRTISIIKSAKIGSPGINIEFKY